METPTDPKKAVSLRKRLQKLLRVTMKCFYELKDLLIIDMLIREKQCTEQRLESVLKMDVKLIRVSLSALRSDHLIRRRVKAGKNTITAAGKKSKSRIDYYSIKYENIVDVVRYKLDNVQKRVETLERLSVNSSSFRCNECDRSWTDMEAGELFNIASKRFCCIICRKPVEGISGDTGSQLHFLMSRFNDDVSPIYDLLKECDGQDVNESNKQSA